MRTRKDIASVPYGVELTPEAWAQVGRLSLPAFRRLERALAEAATRLDDSQQTGVVEVDGHRARYRVDAARRRLTLLEVARGLPPAE